MLATIISNVPQHPSPHGTGMNPVCTESDSMAEIVWEVVRTISQIISRTMPAPEIIKNRLKTNEKHVLKWEVMKEIVWEIACTISLTISAPPPTQFPRIEPELVSNSIFLAVMIFKMLGLIMFENFNRYVLQKCSHP